MHLFQIRTQGLIWVGNESLEMWWFVDFTNVVGIVVAFFFSCHQSPLKCVNYSQYQFLVSNRVCLTFILRSCRVQVSLVICQRCVCVFAIPFSILELPGLGNFLVASQVWPKVAVWNPAQVSQRLQSGCCLCCCRTTAPVNMRKLPPLCRRRSEG